MSLDISLFDKKTGVEVASMNWLRNPYGLCQWAEDNYTYTKQLLDNDLKPKLELWDVINKHAYKRSSRVDRKKFLKVVNRYWKVLSSLKEGYFFFDIGSFLQFVQPHFDLIPKEPSLIGGRAHIKGQVFLYNERQYMIGIPMQYFADKVFNLGRPSLGEYKAWFEQLVDFAWLLQDKKNRFYCSN